MRILTYTSLYPNAEQPAHGIFIHQRMRHVAARPGNEVIVVAPVPYFPSWMPGARWQSRARVPDREVIDGLTVYHPRYFLLPKVSMPLHGWLMYIGSRGIVRRLHREHRFDCIDAHYVYPDGYAAARIARQLKVPLSVSARGTDMNLFPRFRTVRPMIHAVLREASLGIGVCSPLRDAMVQHGMAPERATVIGNGVDIERFGPQDRAESRGRKGIAADAEVVVAVGGLIERKGFHLLIPAAAEVARSRPNLRVYIIGEGPERTALASMIENLGLRDRVFLAGPSPNSELKYWYSAADASSLCSSREGWANVLLESMACGTPVVATGVWGTPEVITSPELGVIVERTAPSIAQGLEQALRKTWNRAAIADYARRRTWDVVAAEVEEALARICR